MNTRNERQIVSIRGAPTRLLPYTYLVTVALPVVPEPVAFFPERGAATLHKDRENYNWECWQNTYL